VRERALREPLAGVSRFLGPALEPALTRPTGFVVAEKRVEWLQPRSGGQNVDDMQPSHLPY
jgi:hypothetical protein